MYFFGLVRNDFETFVMLYCLSQWHAEGVGCFFKRVGRVGRKIQSVLMNIYCKILEHAKSEKCEGFWRFHHSFGYFFSGCWWSVGWNIQGVKYFSVFFLWNIEGVQHAAIFYRFFWGCQHGVGERVSLRGAVVVYQCFFQWIHSFGKTIFTA